MIFHPLLWCVSSCTRKKQATAGARWQIRFLSEPPLASAFQYLTSIQKPLSPSLPSNYDQITTTYFLSMSKCLRASAPFNVFEGTQLIFSNKNQPPSKVAAQYCFGFRLLKLHQQKKSFGRIWWIQSFTQKSLLFRTVRKIKTIPQIFYII